MSDVNVQPSTAQVSYFVPISMGRITAVFTGVVWAIKNGPTGRIRLRAFSISATFDGVGGPSTAIVSVYRFAGLLLPTGGIAMSPVKKDSRMTDPSLLDARQSATEAIVLPGGLTREVYPFSVMNNQRNGSATNSGRHEFGFNDSIVINPNEGICISYDVPTVVGDCISGYVTFDEI